MLRDSALRLSAAVICSPSAAHLRHVTQLVDAGIPLLVEKPPWIAGDDPSQVIKRIAAKKIPVLVGMTTRFEPGVHALHDAARAGEFGSILSITDEIFFKLEDNQLARWYSASAKAGGGVVLTNGVHAVDRVSWVLGEPLRLVWACLATVDNRRESEDFATMALMPRNLDTSDDGHDATEVRISLLWSRYEPSPSRLLVVGSEGTGWVDANGRWIVRGRSGETTGHRRAEHNNHHAQWQSFRCLLQTGVSDGQLAEYSELVDVMKVLDDALRGPRPDLERSGRRLGSAPDA
jgi:predicted dehydrogenase